MAALFLLPAVSYAAIRVSVMAEAFVNGQTITLGDIAEISGDEPARIAILKQIPLGSAPLPGAKTMLSRENLNARLAASQINFNGVVWDPAPEWIAITAGGQVISGETLAATAKAKLEQRLPADASAEYAVTLLQELPDTVVPLGAVSYEVPEKSIRFGIVQTVYLVIAVDGVQYSRIPVKCEVKRLEAVLTAAVDITSRQMLTADAVRLTRLDSSRLTGGYLKDPAQAVGLTVNRSLPAGSVIYSSYLNKPVIVKRGTPVVIAAKLGSVEATAGGIAQHDGREGQFIAVRNTATGRVVTAQVVDAGRVLVLTQ